MLSCKNFALPSFSISKIKCIFIRAGADKNAELDDGKIPGQPFEETLAEKGAVRYIYISLYCSSHLQLHV